MWWNKPSAVISLVTRWTCGATCKSTSCHLIVIYVIQSWKSHNRSQFSKVSLLFWFVNAAWEPLILLVWYHLQHNCIILGCSSEQTLIDWLLRSRQSVQEDQWNGNDRSIWLAQLKKKAKQKRGEENRCVTLFHGTSTLVEVTALNKNTFFALFASTF